MTVVVSAARQVRAGEREREREREREEPEETDRDRNRVGVEDSFRTGLN